MGRAEQKAKDSASAARLREEEGRPALVRARKASRLAAHMNRLRGDNYGSAAYRRMKAAQR